MRRNPKPPAWALLEGRAVLYWRQAPLAGLKAGTVARIFPRREEARVRPVAELRAELVPLASIRSVLYRREEVPLEAFLEQEAARRASREEARKKPADRSSSEPSAAEETGS